MKINFETSRVKPEELEISVNKIYVRDNIKAKEYTYGGKQIINYQYRELEFTPEEYFMHLLKNQSGIPGVGGDGTVNSNLEGKVTTLEKSLKEATDKITKLETDRTNLLKEIEGLKTKDTNLEGSIGQINTKNTELESSINELKEKDTQLQQEIDALKTKQ